MPLERCVWNGTAWIPFQNATLPPAPVFVPGVDMPMYQITSDFSGAKNVGNLPGTTLTPYLGTLAGGGALVQLAAGTYSNIDFGDRRLDPRNAVTLNNCRVTLTTGNLAAGSVGINGLVIRNNATTSGLLVMNDCEIHNRAQRNMNTFMGRNTIMNRCVLTGGVDGADLQSTGTAARISGLEVNDCWIGDMAWWYAPTTGVVHPSDTQTHNDGIQVQDTLGLTANNCFFGAWPSEYVGTGTPGSGSETNDYVDPSYIQSQATMDGWRATNLNRITRDDQSFQGVPRKSTTGGSWTGVLFNKPNGTINHCWFSGGTVQINASDPTLTTATGIVCTQNTHWNDMTGGHSLTTTAKGITMYFRADHTYTVGTGTDVNKFFDGTTTTPFLV